MTCTKPGSFSTSSWRRTSALTVYPRNKSLRIKTRPMRPVAPVTNTVVNFAFGVSNSPTELPLSKSAS